MEHGAPTSLAAFVRTAAADCADGLRNWQLWSKFAWHDMIARYRRSWVGPFWIVLSAAIFIGALSVVYSTLFRTDIRDYIPYVAVGFVLWGFISAIAAEGVSTFVEAESYIRQIRINPFIYVLRVCARNVIVFGHQFAVVLVILLLFGKLHFSLLPLAGLGLILFLFQSVWVSLLLGLVGTRFRDLQPLIANLLQVLFFITPVIWSPALLGDRQWIAEINPFFRLIEIVRAPLLGTVPPLTDYLLVFAITAAGSLLAAIAYGRFNSRIVYWL